MAADPISSSDLVKGEFLSPGEKFGDYQVMQCLSFDLFGGVYRMQHIIEFNEECVFVIPKALGETEGFTDRVYEQVNLLTNVEHQYIAKVEGHTEINGRTCLLLEAIEGISLLDYVEKYAAEQQRVSGAADADAATRKSPQLIEDFPFGLPPVEAKLFLKQCVEAIREGHNGNVKHLLLNPNFIIVSPEGTLKITGFGLYDMIGPEILAQLAESGAPSVALGPRRVTLNAFDLVDPLALASGEEQADEGLAQRSDYFSLGQNGYYMLTGHKAKPIRGADDDTGGGAYKPAAQFSAAIQPGWDSFFGKCLDPDRQKRYANCKALLADLDRADRVVEVKKEAEASLADRIARIPIPKKIADKIGPENLKFVRLGLLGIFAMIVVSIASLCYSIIFAEEDQAAGPAIRRAKEGQKPSLNLALEPANAKVVFSRNGEASFITTNGTLGVIMARGEYEVTVIASDHLSRTETIDVGRDGMEMAVRLTPAWGMLEVTGIPGSRVIATRKNSDPVDLGLIPEEGKLRARKMLYSGEYNVEVSHPRYRSVAIEDVRLPRGRQVSREVEMEPKPGKVQVLTVPEGALVTMDDKRVGTTPVKVDELPLATDLVFKVTLPNYRGQEYTLQLEAGDDIAVDFGALEHAKGTINPEVTVNGEPINVEQAKKVVFRIGEQTFTGAGKPLQGVYAGPGNIEIIYPDHQIWKQRLRLADLESVTVVADLIPLPGVVAITVDSPVAFRIVVEGKTVKGVDNRYEVRANRDQTVEVRAKDHLTMKRTVRLKPSEELAWNVTMFTIPEPSEGDDWAVPYVGVKLVWIPQGEVRVGSPPSEQGRLPDEGPRTTVRFPTGFWVGRYEVTQEEYRGVIGSNPSEFLGGDRPVERVAWADAMAFCRKVTDLERASNRLPEGYVYRLPTEAEWEYMARAGSEEAFHFGAKADPSKGNFKGVYPRDSADSDGEGKTNESDELYGTAKVGNYTSNAWKIFDVHGNVGEWCYDRFNSRYPGGIVSDWSGPKSGSDRLHRGGGWASFAQRCRLAARERLKPETATSSLGFRMVLGRAIVAE